MLWLSLCSDIKFFHFSSKNWDFAYLEGDKMFKSFAFNFFFKRVSLYKKNLVIDKLLNGLKRYFQEVFEGE